mgnify:CR=1 FL=1
MAVSNALVTNEHPATLAQRFAGFFDRVLVDAPCSGEGMFRKEEAAVTDWSQETVEMCARRQTEILSSAAALIRPGGRLVYSTCTFSPEEDEQIETAVRLSGLTKQDYITRRLMCREVVVQGNPRVYKALRNEFAAVLVLSLIHI